MNRVKSQSAYDRQAAGGRIRKKRTTLGMTLEELAKRVDRVPKYCADIERGNCGMSLETLLIFCEVLNMTPNYVLLGKSTLEEEKMQTDEEKAILTMIHDCSEQKRYYAMELLKLYLKSF